MDPNQLVSNLIVVFGGDISNVIMVYEGLMCCKCSIVSNSSCSHDTVSCHCSFYVKANISLW